MYRGGIFFKTFQTVFITSIISIFLYTAFIIPWYKDSIIKVLAIASQNTASSIQKLYGESVKNDDLGSIVKNSRDIIAENSNILYIIVSKKDDYALIHYPKKEWSMQERAQKAFWHRFERINIQYEIIENKKLNTELFHYISCMYYVYRHIMLSILW